MAAPVHGNPDASIRATDLTRIGIAELLFVRRAKNVQPKWMADILDRLIWLTDDNGDSILEELHRWLGCDEEMRVAIALSLQDCFLWHTDEEMHQAIERIRVKFPALISNCDDRVAAWRAQFPRDRPTP